MKGLFVKKILFYIFFDDRLIFLKDEWCFGIGVSRLEVLKSISKMEFF